MSIDEKVGHCSYKEVLQYQRFMSDDEKLLNKEHNAFCLVEDDRCPYYSANKSKCYCKANERYKK